MSTSSLPRPVMLPLHESCVPVSLQVGDPFFLKCGDAASADPPTMRARTHANASVARLLIVTPLLCFLRGRGYQPHWFGPTADPLHRRSHSGGATSTRSLRFLGSGIPRSRLITSCRRFL